MLSNEHEAMQKQILAPEAYLSRISLGNFTCADFELGWQVKIFKLRLALGHPSDAHPHGEER